MGTGKGEPDHWVAVIRPGKVLFELAGVSEAAARECFARVAYSCRSAFVWSVGLISLRVGVSSRTQVG